MTAMPTWEGFLTPVLRALGDGSTLAARALQDRVADAVGLSDAEREEQIDSGQPRFRNRIGWAASSLARAEAVVRPRRGTYVITSLGHELLERHPGGMTEADLLVVPAYRDYVPATKTSTQPTVVEGAPDDLDPMEQVAAGVTRLHDDVAAQLLTRLRAASPDFLEQSVLKVLVAMGYGGVEQSARRIGGSGDGGIDGVIDQDALGLARIYVQAKRYSADNVVGRPQIQGFVGALHGQQAHQGVFITTSSFSREAGEYARSVSASVILIDGERLAELMIKYSVGVQPIRTYTLVKLDEDFFE
jgi:restriction system protein